MLPCLFKYQYSSVSFLILDLPNLTKEDKAEENSQISSDAGIKLLKKKADENEAEVKGVKKGSSLDQSMMTCFILGSQSCFKGGMLTNLKRCEKFDEA